MGLINRSGDSIDSPEQMTLGGGGTTYSPNANTDTAQGDVINDVRSQIRPDVTSSPIEDSTSNADSNDVSVTGTGTPTVNITTPTGTTEVNTSDGSNDPQPNNQPTNDPQPDTAENSGIPADLDGGVLAVIAAVAVLVVGGGLTAVFS